MTNLYIYYGHSADNFFYLPSYFNKFWNFKSRTSSSDNRFEKILSAESAHTMIAKPLHYIEAAQNCYI